MKGTIGFDAEAYLNIMAPLAGITFEPQWRANVQTHLQIAAEMAKQLESVPIDSNRLELANRFIPGIPLPTRDQSGSEVHSQ